MKMYIKVLLLLVIGGVIQASEAFAQDFEKDVAAVRSSYENTKRLSIDIDVTVYNRLKNNEQVSRSRVSLKKEDRKFKYNVDDRTMLLNEDCLLLVDHQEHKIVYQRREENGQAEAQLTEQAMPDVEKMLGDYDKIEFLGTANGLKHYRLSTKSDDHYLEKMEVWINEKHQMLEKIVYLYNPELYPENNKVVVKYQNINTAPKFSSSEFSEKTYIQKQGLTFRAHKNYQNYAVVTPQ